MNIWVLLLFGLVLRIALLVYGMWQDRTMTVKFTDVDYYVFHDAAEYMAKWLLKIGFTVLTTYMYFLFCGVRRLAGESPYQRATYRYSPLLAMALQPNIWWTPQFGKLLFILFDLMTGYCIYDIMCSRQASRSLCLTAAGLWLFNPLTATVSSRGNAESVMSVLVLVCLKLLLEGHHLLAGCLFAMSIHFKIYPVTYALAIYLYLRGQGHYYGDGMNKGEGRNRDQVRKVKRWKEALKLILPNRDRLIFIFSSASVLTVLTTAFYIQYGWEFLYETYLYHVTRKDTRHNFSVYFYMLYLQSKGDNSLFLGLLAFIPQVVLLVIFSVKYYKDPPLAFFLNTFAFVTFNKVCTTQYFFWYLSIFPLLLGNLSMSMVRASSAVILWFLGQGLWLLPAYYLEFEGKNTFLWIWLAGLLFFAINLYVIYVIIDSYSPSQQRTSNQPVSVKKISKHYQKRQKIS